MGRRFTADRISLAEAKEIRRLKVGGTPHHQIRARFSHIAPAALDQAILKKEPTAEERDQALRLLDRGRKPADVAELTGLSVAQVIWVREFWVGARTYAHVASASHYRNTAEGVEDALGPLAPPMRNIRYILAVKSRELARKRKAAKAKREQTPEQKARVAAYRKKTEPQPAFPEFKPYEPRW